MVSARWAPFGSTLIDPRQGPRSRCRSPDTGVSSIAVSLTDGNLVDEFGDSRDTALDPRGRSEFTPSLPPIVMRSISSEAAEFPFIDEREVVLMVGEVELLGGKVPTVVVSWAGHV